MDPDITNDTEHKAGNAPLNKDVTSGEGVDDVTIESYNDGPPLRKTADGATQELRAKLEQCKKERQEYLDGWQRAKADYVNLVKRGEDERTEYSKFAKESMVAELIPILESFAMARKNKEAWENIDPSWRTGIEHIHTQLLQVLNSNGLVEVNPLGAKFDPNQDTAIATIPTSDELQDHVVAEVVQMGYRLNGKLVRSSQVVVYEYREKQ